MRRGRGSTGMRRAWAWGGREGGGTYGSKSGGRTSRGLRGLVFVIAIAAGCDDDPVGPFSRSRNVIPPATGCTNPHHTGPSPTGGLEPRQIAAAYGIDKLWDAGFHGQGRRVALIEFRQRLDTTRFREYSDCWGPFALPHETILDSGVPPIRGGEANFDPEVLLAVAPGVERIDMFETVTGTSSERLADLLAAALDPARTGGERVHTISISFSECEASWSPAHLERANAQLRRAAELGVTVFVSGGDAGSLGSFHGPGGKVRCVPWPVPSIPPPGVQLAVSFPPSSPWVISVGGTELAINGRIPEAGSIEGGVVTNEVVWNQAAAGGRYAGGGGRSEIFSVTDAAWQQLLGLSGMFHRPT